MEIEPDSLWLICPKDGEPYEAKAVRGDDGVVRLVASAPFTGSFTISAGLAKTLDSIEWTHHFPSPPLKA